MSDHYGLVVRFRLRPGSEAAFDRLVAETIDEIQRREPRTLMYSDQAPVAMFTAWREGPNRYAAIVEGLPADWSIPPWREEQ